MSTVISGPGGAGTVEVAGGGLTGPRGQNPLNTSGSYSFAPSLGVARRHSAQAAVI